MNQNAKTVIIYLKLSTLCRHFQDNCRLAKPAQAKVLNSPLFVWMESYGVTIPIQAMELYFSFLSAAIMLYKVVLTFESVDKILKCNHSDESYWAVLSCGAVMLYMMILTFVTVDEILKYDHSNESYWAVFSCGTVMLYIMVLAFVSVVEILKYGHSNESYWVVLSRGTVMLYMVVLTFVSGWNPLVWPFKCELLNSSFLWYCLFYCTKCIKI